MFLEKIQALQKEEVARRKAATSPFAMKEAMAHLPPPRDFLGSISLHKPLALIAEIKPASPSAGVIQKDPDLPRIARQYQAGGAGGISVLTERRFFHGDLAHLRQVKRETSLPLLQKDFVIDPFQIYEGRSAGADAILLIAALLEKSQLEDFGDLVRELGMVPWVEIHDEEDLEKISGLDFPLLGINNRNLKTLAVNLETTLLLKSRIPSGIRVI
ncbi:MAG: indole-3-glycerol phosphate synthase TrpC, partial [Deltaproteobacteria bacterium]|nr:indole-3-glycerol phosphate synthase TrpC [Deltaproteobacteria bacterium]